MQMWKGCENSKKRSWIATDFVGVNGDLICVKETNLNCGLEPTYTAQCEDGTTVIDLFAQDEIFGQKDGSSLNVPPACNAPPGNATKMCHFRYLVQCQPSLCKGFEQQLSVRRLGSAVKAE